MKMPHHHQSCTGEDQPSSPSIMWHEYPSQFSYKEPKELRLLKERLAQVSCKCKICQQNNPYGQPSFEHIKYTKDIETQSEGLHTFSVKTMYAESAIRDALCPTCCMTLNLLRGGVIRVLKDEDTETTASMFSSDKSTDKGIPSQPRVSALKNTCLSPVSPLSQKCSMSSCDNLTDSTSSEVTVRNTFNNSGLRKRNSEKVTFLDLPAKPQSHHGCVCLQNFMDSIRPPLNLLPRYR